MLDTTNDHHTRNSLSKGKEAEEEEGLVANGIQFRVGHIPLCAPKPALHLDNSCSVKHGADWVQVSMEAMPGRGRRIREVIGGNTWGCALGMVRGPIPSEVVGVRSKDSQTHRGRTDFPCSVGGHLMQRDVGISAGSDNLGSAILHRSRCKWFCEMRAGGGGGRDRASLHEGSDTADFETDVFL